MILALVICIVFVTCAVDRSATWHDEIAAGNESTYEDSINEAYVEDGDGELDEVGGGDATTEFGHEEEGEMAISGQSDGFDDCDWYDFTHDGHSIFAEYDILPFLYEFPTVPRMEIIQMFPAGSIMVEVRANRLATTYLLNSDYETALYKFIGLMSAAGFTRVSGIGPELMPPWGLVYDEREHFTLWPLVEMDPEERAGFEYAVFRMDDVFVSLELANYVPLEVQQSNERPGEHRHRSTIAFLRMAKMEDVNSLQEIPVDLTGYDAELLQLFHQELKEKGFFEYEEIAHRGGGVDAEGYGGNFDFVPISLRRVMHMPPAHITLIPSFHAKFIYEFDGHHTQLIEKLVDMLKCEGFNKIEPTSDFARDRLKNDRFYLDADHVYYKNVTNTGGGCDVVILGQYDTVRNVSIVTINVLRHERHIWIYDK